jgi:hypothetical protein
MLSLIKRSTSHNTTNTKNIDDDDDNDDDDDDDDDNDKSDKTTTTATTTTTNPLSSRYNNKLNFINNNELKLVDMFSASWLISRKRFIEINYMDIKICEDAVFAVAKVKGTHLHKIRNDSKMLKDWTQFSVEHLSKYWMMSAQMRSKKNGGDSNGNIIFSHLISMMDNLTERRMRIKPLSSLSSSLSSLQQSQSSNTTQQQQQHQQQQQQQLRPIELQNTIALIAFMPVTAKISHPKYKLTVGKRDQLMSYHSLAATISSLWSVGFGRVVVVSLNENGSEYTRGACEVLKVSSSSSNSSSNGDEIEVVVNINSNSSSSSSSSNNSSDDVNTNRTIATIGYKINNKDVDHHLERTMDIAHVHITDQSLYETSNIKKNIPRAAVAGLWMAMTGKFNSNNDNTVNTADDDDDTSNDIIKEERSKWLGRNHDFDYWKYVWLTEPDSILNMNTNLLSSFKDSLDEGIALFPHRIHPLPHEINLSKDMIPHLDRGKYLPNSYPFNVSELVCDGGDADEGGSYDNYIACCDAGRQWPGNKCWRKEKIYKGEKLMELCKEKWRRDEERKCAFWWSCGFKEQNTTTTNTTAETELIIERHHNLLEYKWKRIKDGIGAVFGSANNGRTCIPSKIPCEVDNGAI